MRLQIVTPLQVAVDAEGVASVRAEDPSGAFGILPGHADFVTGLAVSVLTWRDDTGAEHRIAVRGGVLRVENGDFVQVATRQAVGGDTLETLGAAVLERLREDERLDSEARTSVARLHIGLIRQLERYLEAGRGFAPQARGPQRRTGGERAPAEEGAA